MCSKLEKIICCTCHWNKYKDPELPKAYTGDHDKSSSDSPRCTQGLLPWRPALALQKKVATTSSSSLGLCYEQQLSFQSEMMQLQSLVALSAASGSMMGRW